MSQDLLYKLQGIVTRRFRQTTKECFPELKKGMFLSSPGREKVRRRWIQLCESIGIKRSFDYPEEIQGSVVVCDPEGNWLRMTEETALKILTLGML